jgi:2-iminobutanoate/2-iminopropanoate deaminase
MPAQRRLLALAACVIITACGVNPSDPGRAGSPPGPARAIIATDAAPAAIGPYSQAVLVGGQLFLSGQIGLDPVTGEMVAGGVEAEARQVLANARAVLRAAGFTTADVVQCTVFLADMNDYAAVNRIYAETFAEKPPARAAVEVARLPRDARVEIMMTAIRGER